ncbi:MAG: SIMPL domain-containing protein [Acidobacteriota bacterium]|nr:SIMPL domain-containing protein [Acidobacteriota bacterium]
MKNLAIAAAILIAMSGMATAQQPGQPEVKIDSANRTLSVSATDEVSVEPEVAVLHIGFETAPTDAKSAYAAGSRTSNAVIAALKQAGVAESDIRSQSQYLAPDYTNPKQHKYKLTQQWTVRCAPERAAEILDIAVDAGATSSGQIDWEVKDEKALQEKALDKAAARVRANAAALAKGMGVELGKLIYVSNQESGGGPRPMMMARAFAMKADNTAPLAVEPQKVTSQATVSAVFALE